MRSPAIRISPPSGLRNPAARLRRVVLPQPDGPSRVMNSPCLIAMVTASSAVVSPKRFVTASNRTAPSSAAAGRCALASLSVTFFNVQYLTETEIRVRKDEQRGRARDVHDGQRRHRGIG